MNLAIHILKSCADYKCSSNARIIDDDLVHRCNELLMKYDLEADDIKRLIDDINWLKYPDFVKALLLSAWKDLLVVND